MDATQKQILKAELAGIKAMISGSTSSTSLLSQSSFPAAGGIVIIPSLPMAAQAFRAQSECMEKLAGLIDKLIEKL